MNKTLVFLILAFLSCNNLFHHEYDPVFPAPVIQSVFPVDGEENVSLNINIYVRFSCSMDESTITDETFIVTKIEEKDDGGENTIVTEQIRGILEFDNEQKRIASFELPGDSYFEAHKKYGITIKREIAASSGKTLEDDFESAFYTGDYTDLDPPELLSISPDYLFSNQEAPLMSFVITITFNEPLSPLSVINNGVILTDLHANSDFDSTIFTDLVLIYTPSGTCILTVDAGFKNILDPPGDYQMQLKDATAIKDCADNTFTGTIDSVIHHHIYYKTPCKSPCFMTDQGTDCCW